MEHLLANKGKGRVVFSLDKIEAKPSNIFCFDLETHGGTNADVGNPSCSFHGIAGCALCNVNGESFYIVVNDNRDYGGVPIADQIINLQKKWFVPGAIAIGHNGAKYDLGFLVKRGLDISKVRNIDTWLISTIKNECAYKSSKLKDIMRDQFKIETNSETVIKNYLVEHNTENYGDIPPELMGPYAADDVLYTLVLYFSLLSEGVPREVWQAHDLLLRNSLHLNEAEARGIAIDRPALKEALALLDKKMQDDAKAIKEALGAMEVDVYDQNQAMTVLHSKNLHSGPRDWYGEKKYVLDPEYLLSTGNEMARSYHWFARRQNFVKFFSGSKGVMSSRIWLNEQTAGFHPMHFLSASAKGGIPHCRLPDFLESVPLSNEIRKFFVPRPGHKFVVIQFCDLPVTMLAHYVKDSALAGAVSHSVQVDSFLAKRIVAVDDKNFPSWVSAVSLWLLKEFQGSGDALFERRLKMAQVKIPGYDHYKIKDTLAAKALKCKDGAATYAQFKSALEKTFESSALIDIAGRPVRPEKTKRWRGLAILLQSSSGGMVSICLDMFARLGKAMQASLLLAHEDEMVFECEETNGMFEAAIATLMKDYSFGPVRPQLRIAVQSRWCSQGVNAHLRTYQRIVP